MSQESILVLGAGELGMSVLKALQKVSPPSTKVTVLLRPSTISSTDSVKSKEISLIKSLGISLLPGDIATSTASELATLFAPFSTIVSCLGFASGPGSQLKIAQAVLRAEVPRYVPWQFGVDYDVIGRGSAQDLFDEQLDVRDLLRSQGGTEWIIVSTGLFTSFLFEQAFGIVELDAEGGPMVRGLGGWETELTCTTAEDIGKLTALILLEREPRVRNEVVYVAGDTISCGRLAEVVQEVLGKEVKREEWPVEKLKQDLMEQPDDLIRKYRVVFGEGRGVSWPLEKTFNWRKGIEVVSVRGWLEANKS